MSEWSEFRVGKPSTRPNWTEPTCQPFDTVTHTSHIDSALSIVSQREIRSGLIFDESKLNTERILVSWVSPNTWAWGYRYGNIHFSFDITSIIRDRQFFWVESVAYKIPACRILITDRDRSDTLQRYDPTKPNGPWWYDTGSEKHYYNGQYCLEFMVESALPLTVLRDFDFVDHHSQWCSIHRNNPSKCKELGFRAHKGGAYFLSKAAMAGVDLRPVIERLYKPQSQTQRALSGAFVEMIYSIAGFAENFSGPITASSKDAAALGRSILGAFSHFRVDDAKILASKFANYGEFSKTIGTILTEATGVEDWSDWSDRSRF